MMRRVTRKPYKLLLFQSNNFELDKMPFKVLWSTIHKTCFQGKKDRERVTEKGRKHKERDRIKQEV